eukprot:scaffold20776_cov52-Skeletonema_dohrnii-CCMP3373.AAC.1
MGLLVLRAHVKVKRHDGVDGSMIELYGRELHKTLPPGLVFEFTNDCRPKGGMQRADALKLHV